jgi:hypothetical protein
MSTMKRLSPAAAEMDWAGWALFGLLATAALTVVLIATQMAGLTLSLLGIDDVDSPRVRGTIDAIRAELAALAH